MKYENLGIVAEAAPMPPDYRAWEPGLLVSRSMYTQYATH